MLKSRKCSLSGSLSQNRTHGKFPGDGHGSLALITTLCFRKVHSLFMAAKHNKRAEFEIFWSGWKHLMNGWKLCSPKCGGGWRCELGGRTQRQDNDISQAKARNWIIHMVQKTYGENSFPTPRCDSAFYRPLHTASRTECLFPPPSLSPSLETVSICMIYWTGGTWITWRHKMIVPGWGLLFLLSYSRNDKWPRKVPKKTALYISICT